LSSAACFVANAASSRFFQCVAVALEREAFALESLPGRFDAAAPRQNPLHALRNLAKGQRFDTCYFQRRGDHRVRKGSWPASVMPAHEGAYAAVAPCASPVVDRLVTDAKLLSDDLRLDLAPKLQQARCTRACIPAPVICCNVIASTSLRSTTHFIRYPSFKRLPG
jgi:hypothetical protein